MAFPPIDKVSVANQALTMIGHGDSYFAAGEDFIAGQVDKIWPLVIAECFQLHDWSWMRRTRKLTRTAAMPENGWPYEFQLPGDRIGPVLAVLQAVTNGRGTALRDYDIEGGYLYAAAPDVWARCKVEVDPAQWDQAFLGGFVVALASGLAVPVTQDVNLADQLRQQAFGSPSQQGAGGIFGRLMAQDRAAAPIGGGVAWSDPLTDARV